MVLSLTVVTNASRLPFLFPPLWPPCLLCVLLCRSSVQDLCGYSPYWFRPAVAVSTNATPPASDWCTRFR